MSTTGKQKASRIPLDYYKKPDGVVRWKKLLTYGAGIATAVWIGSLFLFGGTKLGQARFSHGPVAAAHQPIADDCAACHVDFALLASKQTMDSKCQTCHLQPPMDVHHVGQKASLTPNCGTCHTDHKGELFNLTRAADKYCTVCHEDLDKSMEDGFRRQELWKDGIPRENTITAFAKDHPEFHVLKKVEKGKEADPGKLKFNHKYHLTPGIVLTPGGTPFRVGDIEVAFREKYRLGRKDGDPVQLECASCHGPSAPRDMPGKIDRPDPNTDRAGWEAAVRQYFEDRFAARMPRLETGELQPPRRNGAYMAKIQYQEHCAGCHPLTVDPRLDQPVEHGLQPDEVRAALTKVYKREFEKNDQLLASRPSSFVPLPGKQFTADRPDAGLIDRKVEQAMRELMVGKRACGECHFDEKGGEVSVATQRIAPPNVPEIWFTHARFNHVAHTDRGIGCKECHPGAYPSGDKDLLAAYALPRKGAEKVMIEGIDYCRKCHAPEPAKEFLDRGLEAKHDCTECHSYHHGGDWKPETRASLTPHEEKKLHAWLREPLRK